MTKNNPLNVFKIEHKNTNTQNLTNKITYRIGSKYSFQTVLSSRSSSRCCDI